MTQEVAYESLPLQTRAALHEQLAVYLKGLAGDDTERYVDLLAYHYDHSANLPKRRHYLRQAGEAAQARYANDSAVDYLSRALALTPEDEGVERYNLLLKREMIYTIQGNRDAQAHDLLALAQLVDELHDDR